MRERTFNDALDKVNTSANRLGDGGVINLVKREAEVERWPRAQHRRGSLW